MSDVKHRDKGDSAVERCACGKHIMERWCGTYAEIGYTHTRPKCWPDAKEAPMSDVTPTPEQERAAREWLTTIRQDGPRLNWFANEREVANAVSLLAPSLATLLATREAALVAERDEWRLAASAEAARRRELTDERRSLVERAVEVGMGYGPGRESVDRVLAEFDKEGK